MVDVLNEDEQDLSEDSKKMIRLARGGMKAAEGFYTQVIKTGKRRG